MLLGYRFMQLKGAIDIIYYHTVRDNLREYRAPGGAKPPSFKGIGCSGKLDGFDSNIGTNNVNGILGLDNEIGHPTFDFYNWTGIFLITLN